MQTPSIPTSKVLEIVGVSARQLDHWCAKGLIPGQPQRGDLGSGFYRSWTPSQIDRVCKIHYAVRQADSILASVGLTRSGGR